MYKGEGKGGPNPRGGETTSSSSPFTNEQRGGVKPNDNISLFVHSSTPLSLTGESREYLLLIPIQSLILPQPILLYA